MGKKYEGVNPVDMLKPGEPFFFLRAQDKLFPEMTEYYCYLCLKYNLMSMATDARASTIEGVEWQKENPQHVKLPD